MRRSSSRDMTGRFSRSSASVADWPGGRSADRGRLRLPTPKASLTPLALGALDPAPLIWLRHEGLPVSVRSAAPLRLPAQRLATLIPERLQYHVPPPRLPDSPLRSEATPRDCRAR